MTEFNVKQGETLSIQVKGRETGVSLVGDIKAAVSNQAPPLSAPVVKSFVVTDSTFDGVDSWLISTNIDFDAGKYAFDLKRSSGGQVDKTDTFILNVDRAVTA